MVMENFQCLFDTCFCLSFLLLRVPDSILFKAVESRAAPLAPSAAQQAESRAQLAPSASAQQQPIQKENIPVGCTAAATTTTIAAATTTTNAAASTTTSTKPAENLGKGMA